MTKKCITEIKRVKPVSAVLGVYLVLINMTIRILDKEVESESFSNVIEIVGRQDARLKQAHIIVYVIPDDLRAEQQ
jgi:hypothetical protein